MKAISLDLRERIIDACEAKEQTQKEIARRYRVSFGLVRKLVAQKKALGHVENLFCRVGRHRKLSPAQEAKLAKLIDRRPDMTLAELRDELGVECVLSTLHYAIARIGKTYKKRV